MPLDVFAIEPSSVLESTRDDFGRAHALGHRFDDVAAIAGANSSDREYARVGRCKIRVGGDVPAIRKQRRRHELSIRSAADERKQSGAFDLGEGAALHVADTDARDAIVAKNRGELTVPNEANVFASGD